MIKTILVPATGNFTDATTYPLAFAIARLLAAHVDALHVAADPVELVVNLASDGAGASGVLSERLIADMKAHIDARQRAAQRNFAEACARDKLAIAEAPAVTDGPSAQWHSEVGQEPLWMVNYGMTADVIVVSRGKQGEEAEARATLEAVLLETGRPVLVPGTAARSPTSPDRIAIAWKPTPQASRAIAGALPLLERAKTVTVLSVDEDPRRGEETGRLADYLAWHGIRPVIKRLGIGANGGPETLLSAACETADLLVMGGYGHARLREWVFGGFTQRVLEDAPIPVLLAH